VNNYNFTEDWTSSNIDFWFEMLSIAGLDYTDKLSILELGVFEARTSCWISDTLLNHPDSTLQCVDALLDKRQTVDKILNNISQSKNSDKVEFHYAMTTKYFRMFPDTMYDVIYVDANHRRKSVLLDGLHAYHHLNDGGIVIFDDYLNLECGHEVRKALDELESSWDLKMIGESFQKAYAKNA